ncbi:MAG: hypothetical protein WC444_01935 [Candidatus Paceibacterota bacterium]
MKKLLLGAVLILSSCTLTSAQIQVGQVNGTLNGLPVGVNGQTGVIQVSNGNGGGLIYNANTGGYQIGGTIGGVPITVGNGTLNVGGTSGSNGVLGLLALAQLIIKRLAPFLVGMAMLAFFWFLIEFIWKGRNSADEQQKSLRGMAYSVLALFVMVSVWGIIGFAGSVLGINQGGMAPKTCLPGETSC